MLAIKPSVLIVENDQTLFIVDNTEDKSTIQLILESPLISTDEIK